MKCPFCNPIDEDIVARNELCYARWDGFPVSRGHLLVIPFRHTPDFFSMTPEEHFGLGTEPSKFFSNQRRKDSNHEI